MAKVIGNDIKKIVADGLPGWKVAQVQSSHDAPMTGGNMPKAHSGVTLAQLKKKFLDTNSAEDGLPADSPEHYTPDTAVKTIRVEPENGGPSKVADIVNGQVKIVQG